MTKHYVHVISDCSKSGVLWPKIVFINNQKADVERIFHTYTMALNEPDGSLLNSYRCLIMGRTMNVTFEGKTSKWFLSQYGKNLYY